jgi:hypothetical protein
MPMLKPITLIAPAGGVHTSLNDLGRWLSFHTTRSIPLLGEEMWRDLSRPQAKMPASDQPEVEHRHYALGWIHEIYRNHPLVVHNGAIDGFTVHLGFIPETGQGLIILMNRSLATEALMALAYSTYDRLLRLPPLDWEKRLREKAPAFSEVQNVALDFPIRTLVGHYQHPAYGELNIQSKGDKLVMRFRSFRITLVYQGNREFLSQNPVAGLAPQISVRFSKEKSGEPLQLFVALNFDEGDPVEVFKKVANSPG